MHEGVCHFSVCWRRETNGSYPFANRLNWLTHFCLLPLHGGASCLSTARGRKLVGIQQRIWINDRSPSSTFFCWKLFQILSPRVLSVLPPPPATADHPPPASCFPSPRTHTGAVSNDRKLSVGFCY
jgi:hypothetical protein